MLGTTFLMATLQQATLAGVVRDSVDLEPVAFAQVSVASVASEAVVGSGISDRFGAFVVPGVSTAGPVRVEVRAFGYSVWAHTYESVPSDPVRVLLAPSPFGLEGLEVTARSRAGDPLSVSRDAFVIDTMLLRSLPTILETDVLRATAVSPSASASSDYTSVPFIRGGTSDGTPVLLDGVRLFNAFHFGGFISAINPEVVKHATLLAGTGGDGLAVGSLSGAIDIATRDGSRDRRRMAGALGLASSRLSVEGPISGNVTYLLDGRRTYIDGATLALKKVGVIDGHAPYFFHDVHAKVTTDLGGVRRLSVSGYLNSESLNHVDVRERVTRTTSTAWGNAALSLHYRDRFSAQGVIDANLGHSRFTSELTRVVGQSYRRRRRRRASRSAAQDNAVRRRCDEREPGQCAGDLAPENTPRSRRQRKRRGSQSTTTSTTPTRASWIGTFPRSFRGSPSARAAGGWPPTRASRSRCGAGSRPGRASVWTVSRDWRPPWRPSRS